MEKEYKLKPPTDQEVNEAMAKFLFGKKYSEQVLKNLPWSLLIVKRLWKRSEDPWGK